MSFGTCPNYTTLCINISIGKLKKFYFSRKIPILPVFLHVQNIQNMRIHGIFHAEYTGQRKRKRRRASRKHREQENGRPKNTWAETWDQMVHHGNGTQSTERKAQSSGIPPQVQRAARFHKSPSASPLNLPPQTTSPSGTAHLAHKHNYTLQLPAHLELAGARRVKCGSRNISFHA